MLVLLVQLVAVTIMSKLSTATRVYLESRDWATWDAEHGDSSRTASGDFQAGDRVTGQHSVWGNITGTVDHVNLTSTGKVKSVIVNHDPGSGGGTSHVAYSSSELSHVEK